MSLLQVRNLTLRFGGLTAVKEVSFSVQEGEIAALIGPNGAGKTSVFNAITGIYEPTSGEIYLEGTDLKRQFDLVSCFRLICIALLSGALLTLAINLEALWSSVIIANYHYQQEFSWRSAFSSFRSYFNELEANYSSLPFFVGSLIGLAGAYTLWSRSRRSPDFVSASGIARTFQNIRLFQQMSVIENVLIGMDSRLTTGVFSSIFRLPSFFKERKKACQEAMAILQKVGLENECQWLAECLSYGHQRRLEIARALASQPKIILLDEPAAGMNPSEASDLMQLIRQIRDQGVTVLLIEHHMKVVMGLSDTIVVLDYGNKIAQGNPNDICSNPKVIAAYLGKEI